MKIAISKWDHYPVFFFSLSSFYNYLGLTEHHRVWIARCAEYPSANEKDFSPIPL